MTPGAGNSLWDDEGNSLLERPVQVARGIGSFDRLPMLLNQLAAATVWRGELPAAAALIAEADELCEATGGPHPAIRSLEDGRVPRPRSRGRRAHPGHPRAGRGRRAGNRMTWAHWTAAILYNGLGRYSDALTPAREASEQVPLYLSMRALPELVEAAARTDNAAVADDALSRLETWTQAGGTDWGLGTEARCRALLSEGAVADERYREALERPGPHSAAAGSGPRPPCLRRVAPPPATPPRCP